MKKLKLVVMLFSIALSGYAQAEYQTFVSDILDGERQIKVLLPRGYTAENKKKYPVIYVFDGDYLFEPVAGNADYYSYWEDIPESIVVGINQLDNRADDLNYSEQNSLPFDKGADFFEFVGKELIPYIDERYKTESFKVAVGHGETANFINYFLVRSEPVFNAYILISPDFAPDMAKYISTALASVQQKIFYYMAVSNTDVPEIMTDANTLNSNLKLQDNKNVFYRFMEHDNVTHYAMPAHVIPKALESIFFVYRPISKKEYTESILKLETSPVEYLTQKYQEIDDLFGIKKQILINDFKAVEAAIKKAQKWEYYEELSKLAKTHYPETVLYKYYLAIFYEKTGDPKNAMKTYRSAYTLDEIAGISKDEMMYKADKIKAEFGF